MVLDIFSVHSTNKLACRGTHTFMMEGRSLAKNPHTFPFCLVPFLTTAKDTPVKQDL
jgi:hypothetical protein